MNAPPEAQVSDLECLAGIAGPAHPPSRRAAFFGPCISRAIERARASREPKPIVAAEASKREPVMARRPRPPPSAPVLPVEVLCYDDLIEVLRARANELELSRESIDTICGLPSGLAGKILGLKSIRRLGMDSLGPILETLGLKLLAVPDEAKLARNRWRFVKRCDTHFRSADAKSKAMRGQKFKKLSGPVTGRLFGWPVPET
jgi:hypothetical protein